MVEVFSYGKHKAAFTQRLLLNLLGIRRATRRLAACLPTTCLLVTCILETNDLCAQPKAIASLWPERIETGDTTGLLILVSGLNAEPKDIDFSPWASIFPISNVIGRSEWHKSGAQWTQRFTLIAFDSATLELPPLYVRVAAGKPLETNALTMTVFPTRVGREITDMATIREITREPESYLDLWPWAAGILAGLILLGWWIRNKQRKVLPVVVPNEMVLPPVSAAEMALQKLSELQKKELWRHGQLKEHYAELSLILRSFLESRYGIAALESTTAEIQQLLMSTDFSPKSQMDLKELLQKADMVKYAKSEPKETVHESVLIKAKALVTPEKNHTTAHKSPNPQIPKSPRK
jgi:hypothetical protein